MTDRLDRTDRTVRTDRAGEQGGSDSIAVIGMACRYPDAASPDELWENVLSGRRAFRRIPDERTPLAEYFSPDPQAADRFYAPNAALIEGYAFDRVRFKIAGSTYRSTDTTHWLALDMAAAALADAGFIDGDGLPKADTAVIVGNTLTGEFTRANLMRLRWPYVRRTVAEQLRRLSWDEEQVAAFLGGLEESYKAPFPPVDADSLAGGLANTIAGRICNYFDLGGGGYTVDGACSSSLLAVAHACRALVDGEADIAIAGGVDLSIDPFELVGFAKTGALAATEMRVYDRRSAGFWPGEGCGMLVLARAADAEALGRPSYARIAGWGISSDGRGGITRPEVAGQRLALERAYAKAGFGADTVGYIEGHGTGTAVGDATEIRAVSSVRYDANPDAARAALGTVKANIGHTKAAAGVAGLIKAVLAIDRRVIPPTTGCVDPHPELAEASVRVLDRPEPWREDRPIRAGVSSMGFGGINTHIALEEPDSGSDGDSGSARGPVRRSGAGGSRPAGVTPEVAALARSAQDAEVLLFDAATPAELCDRLTETAGLVSRLSHANLADLGADLVGRLDGRPMRAAVVAPDPGTAQRRLTRVADLVTAGAHHLLDVEEGIFCGRVRRSPRIVFAFPGQGSGHGGSDGALRRRFAEVEEFHAGLAGATASPASSGSSASSGAAGSPDPSATALAQPRIAAASAAALRVLERLGVTANAALGHSLGELTALHWAGVVDAEALVRMATMRGRLMTETSDGEGAMAGIAAAPDEAEKLIGDRPVVIAGRNAPRQTVVAGPAAEVLAVIAEAEREGVAATRLPVSHAFHSPQVAPAAERFAAYLAGEDLQPPDRTVVSTVTAEPIPPETDIAGLLRTQITSPVRFADAVEVAADDADLVIEVGPGRVLSGLVRACVPAPAVPMDTDSRTLEGVLRVVAACHVLGAPLRPAALFEGRHVKPLPDRIRLFANPCGAEPAELLELPAHTELPAVPALPEPSGADKPPAEVGARAFDAGDAGEAGADAAVDSVELVRALAAERAELPVEAVHPDSALLDELHLSSITVGQLVNDALRSRGLAPPANPLNFATATVRQIAETLDELAELAGTSEAGPVSAPAAVAGVAPWVRPFGIERVPAARREPVAHRLGGSWRLFAEPEHRLGARLRDALEATGVGDGVLVCLPEPGADDADARSRAVPELVLSAAQAALALDPPGRLVLVHHGIDHGAGAMAKTVFLEVPDTKDGRVDVLVVEVPPVAEAIDWVVADVAAASGFEELHYDAAGNRSSPVLRPLVAGATTDDAGPLGGDDVLLVTGGGKGITAECALSLATRTGAAIALLGRADPGQDEELAANLDRFAASGIDHRYLRADVTDESAVRAAVAEVRDTLGPVTAVLHGAGRNVPRRLADLDGDELRATLAPKVDGLRVVLDAVDTAALRLLVTFGSIIGRAGLAGEAHYAMANAALTEATEAYGREHPECRCVALEWSVWSGVGMGERLGAVEALHHSGITPISTDAGLAVLDEVLAARDLPGTVVVTGRSAGLPTVAVERRELPVLRFLDRVLVDYPGIELVTEAELSTGTDPYLADHELEDNLLFPAVLGMEAMAQVACAVIGREDVPAFEDVEFSRPIVVPPHEPVTIRIAALVREPSTVELVIGSAETGFHVDHFRATCRFPGPGQHSPAPPAGEVADPDKSVRLAPVPLDPHEDLYGGVLFQGGRFQRLLGYRRIGATYCTADVAGADGLDRTDADGWFGGFLPAGLLLGDPGVRDTFMQAIQGSRPDQTLLPVGIERVLPGALGGAGRLELTGTERSRDGDAVVWDLAARDETGRVVEQWQGLRLRVVRTHTGPLPDAMLGPYLERMLEGMPGGGPDPLVAVEPHTESRTESHAGPRDREQDTELALSRVTGRAVELRHRPDGRPEVAGAGPVSAAHGAGLTVAVAGGATCDIEVVSERSVEDWRGLLGAGRYALVEHLVAEHGEDLPTAATRVWCAAECGQKAGVVAEPSTITALGEPSGWVRFGAGDAEIATWVTTLWRRDERVVFAFRRTTSPKGT